jgi:hypothetical protein
MNSTINNYEIRTSTTVAGNTGAASRIKITLHRKDVGGGGGQTTSPAPSFRVKVADLDGFGDADNATIAAALGTVTVATVTSSKELIIAPVLPAAATGTLTYTGVVKHGETVTIGSRVYEYVAGAAAQTGRVAVNVAASMTAAQGTLTMDTQPTAGDTVTVGTRTYVWVASGTADNAGEISRGADLAAAKLAFVAAINGTDSVNTANTLVSAAAFTSNTCVLTARIEGTVGNAYVTTETFTAGTNVFDAGTLGTTTAGTDCTAANAITALVTAIGADTSAVVTAVDGAGDTLVATSKVTGTAGNSYASTETLANASWGSATLTGGVAAASGTCYVDVTNATAESIHLLVAPGPFGYPAKPIRKTITHAAP